MGDISISVHQSDERHVETSAGCLPKDTGQGERYMVPPFVYDQSSMAMSFSQAAAEGRVQSLSCNSQKCTCTRSRSGQDHPPESFAAHVCIS